MCDAEAGTPEIFASQWNTPVVEHSTTFSDFHDTAHEPADFAAPLLARGVYLTPWFFRGRRLIVVVDHTHSVIHFEPVTDHGDRDAQVHSLRVMLMALDPMRLTLVGD